MRKDQKVFSSFSDLVERTESEESLARPSAEEEAKIAEKTRAALGKIVGAKLAAAQPTHVEKEDKGAVFIRYTPSQQSNNARPSVCLLLLGAELRAECARNSRFVVGLWCR
jgi:hypothetical protein